MKVVTFWGVHDAVSWRCRGRPLLFDGNDPLKPALDAALRAAIREPLSGGGETPYLAMIGAETPLIYEV